MTNYKIIENCKYTVGDTAGEWSLYVLLYQNSDNYYYVIFDGEEADVAIMSSVVTPRTANALEETILQIIARPQKLETIDDVYATLKNGFYGDMFKLETIA